MTEVIRKPLLSGHCSTHIGHTELSEDQALSHERCVSNGGGNRANPAKEFQPCPCAHHYSHDEQGEPAEVYECGGCGGDIVEAWYWPLDEDGETRYTHIDRTGRALGEDCFAQPKVSRNEPKVEAMRECTRCGSVVDIVDSRICKRCIRDDEREAKAAAKEEEDDLDSLLADLDFD